MEQRQGHPTTVLVAEDEAVVGELICATLEQAGYRVLLVVDGNRALAVIRDEQQPLDALLTDLWLPGVDGAQLARAAAASRPAAAILVSSGLPNGVALPAHVNILTKPFSPQELLAALAAAVARAPAATGPAGSSVE